MSTMTHNRGLRGILDDLPARGLPIPAPSRRPEEVVVAALKAVSKAHKKDAKKAEATIEEYGLTIDVARLRDRLNRAASSELQRLLLSTPGVPEKLFNEAIERQLKDEAEDDDKDESVDALVSKLDEILDALKDRGKGSETGTEDGVEAAAAPVKRSSAPRTAKKVVAP